MMKKLRKQASRNAFRYVLFILFVVGLYSCEFESDNINYVDLEKPQEEIQLGINLAGVNPSELIYVYNNSSFSYSLFTDGKDILVRQFYLDGKPMATNPDTGEGYFDVNIMDNEIHELKLIIALKTGSGSLAEYANYEMYAGEFTFKIKIIPFSDNLNIRETTDKNNYLKLEWDKPSDYEVAGYSVYKGDIHHGELLAKIDNPNHTYFVDTDYAYGYKHFTIVAEIKNSLNNLTVKDDVTVYYNNVTESNFEIQRISTNEILMKWTNPNSFPCKYVLTHGENKEKIILENGINEGIIPVRDFPSWAESFTLYILPKSADIDRYEFYPNVYGVFRDKSFSSISFNVNLQSNMIHALNFTSLNNYDVSTMEQIGATNHNLELHTGCQLKITKGGRVAINDKHDFVHIFSDYSLKHEIAKFKINSYPFHILNEKRILIEENNGFKIYDITTQDVITSKLWGSDFLYGIVHTKISVSSNGNYLYVLLSDYHSSNSNKHWVELYEVAADNTLKLLEKETISNIVNIYFHPINNTEAIFQYPTFYENKFIIFDILTKEKKEIKGEFMNIDPITGNLLFKGEEYQDNQYNIYVWDNNYSKEKIKIKLRNTNPWASASLLNSTLFFNGYCLNLSNLKEWK